MIIGVIWLGNTKLKLVIKLQQSLDQQIPYFGLQLGLSFCYLSLRFYLFKMVSREPAQFDKYNWNSFNIYADSCSIGFNSIVFWMSIFSQGSIPSGLMLTWTLDSLFCVVIHKWLIIFFWPDIKLNEVGSKDTVPPMAMILGKAIKKQHIWP